MNRRQFVSAFAAPAATPSSAVSEALPACGELQLCQAGLVIGVKRLSSQPARIGAIDPDPTCSAHSVVTPAPDRGATLGDAPAASRTLPICARSCVAAIVAMRGPVNCERSHLLNP